MKGVVKDGLCTCRQGVQSDFNLLALRLERDERRHVSDIGVSEDYLSRPRSSLINTGSLQLPTWLTFNRRASTPVGPIR